MFDLAEILPLLFVLLGFVAMVLVARSRRDLFTEERSFPVIAQMAQNIPVDRIESPFTIHIDESRSTLTNGVFVRLRTKIPCELRAFWFVNIQDFYVELDRPDFRNSLLENRFLETKSTHQETFNFEISGDFVQHIQFADAETIFNGNKTTRREYPLVLIVNDPQDFFQTPIQIAALHIKSSISTDPSSKFLLRISKLSDGRSLVLQEIFVPGGFSSDDVCTVCLTEHVSHVLLPCKHACLCQTCFPLIEKCPICQRFVTSYFQI